MVPRPLAGNPAARDLFRLHARHHARDAALITINGFGTTQVAFERLFVPAGWQHRIALSLLFLRSESSAASQAACCMLFRQQTAPGESR